MTHIFYTGPFYAVEDIEYLCPECISSGEAARKYDGGFQDDCSVDDGVEDPARLDELIHRTPGYSGWQQEYWRAHCGDYPDEEPDESLLTVIRQRVGLPVPDEQLPATELDEDADTHAQVQFYWDLSKIRFQPELLLREIIPGDIGGWNGFVSSVYLTGPGPFLYHLYDDRGLDVLGGSQKLLLPLYHQFHDWILEYDLEKIDQMFAPAKE